MVVRRCTRFYRLAGQIYAQAVSFDRPLSSLSARLALRRSVGEPLEIWGRNMQDVLRAGRLQRSAIPAR